MFKRYKTAMTWGAVILAVATGQGTASAQSSVRRTSRDVLDVAKWTSRNNVESGVRTATGNRYIVSSRDRSGPLASPAHRRGASDFVPNPNRNVWGRSDMHRDAASIARRLGPNNSAIVERPSSPISGRRYDQHTSYAVVPPFSDVRVNRYQTPQRATGPHIHVQPNVRRYG